MEGGKRILLIAHGHPDFSPGGAEISAYGLFRGYRDHAAVSEAFFLARHEGDPMRGRIGLHAEREYLWEQALGDDFYMEGRNLESSLSIFADFLKSIKPDLVHLHHAVHMGYEILEIIRRALPDAKICFTLHEYIPICHNFGQMLKTDGGLCEKSGMNACARCFPGRAPEDFWLRKRRFLHYFSHVDVFFAPSKFLRQRYIEWGLEPEKIFLRENGLREIGECPPRPLPPGGKRNRFGYFGQITPFKGLEILLQALASLSPAERGEIRLEIHGGGLDEIAKEREKKLRRKFKNLSEAGTVHWLGAYEPEQLASRMAGVDWVAMPSIWWENSPVVIQEAFACGRPILASNLGGMAEKIRNGLDGILVEAGNPHSWAQSLLQCSRDPVLWEKLRGNIARPVSIADAADGCLKLLGIC